MKRCVAIRITEDPDFSTIDKIRSSPVWDMVESEIAEGFTKNFGAPEPFVVSLELDEYGPVIVAASVAKYPDPPDDDDK